MTTRFTNSAGNGYVHADGFNITPNSVVAAGSNSQANAAPLTAGLVFVVTVSATTRGVKLPTAVTGRQVEIFNTTATAVKPYPATNGKIGAASTNTAGTAIAAGKANIYVAQSTTQWRVMNGA